MVTLVLKKNQKMGRGVSGVKTLGTATPTGSLVKRPFEEARQGIRGHLGQLPRSRGVKRLLLLLVVVAVVAVVVVLAAPTPLCNRPHTRILFNNSQQ